MARIVRGVMNNTDRRKPDAPNQKNAEKSGERRRKKALQPSGGV